MKRRTDLMREQSDRTFSELKAANQQFGQIADELYRTAEKNYNAGMIISEIDKEFAAATKLGEMDVAFLFLATALQCARQCLTSLTLSSERPGDKEAADRVNKGGKKEKSARSNSRDYNPSLLEIQMCPVPFDTNRQLPEVKGALKGAGKLKHRLTLGHDPILGWIFGTANIATSTLTTWELKSYFVETHMGKVKEGKESPMDHIAKLAETNRVLSETFHTKLLNRGMEGLVIVATSICKEWHHLQSDISSKNSLPFPVVSVIDPKIPNAMADYGIDMANICGVTKQAGWAQSINLLIALLHGMLYYIQKSSAENLLQIGTYGNILTWNSTSDPDLDLHKVKTRKILLYSNTLASLANVITVALSKDVGKLDVGGIAVTLYRLISDYHFIQKIKKEFLENRWYDIVMNEEF